MLPLLAPLFLALQLNQAVSAADQRVEPAPLIAPGPPPVLSFRLFEGRSHGRFDNLDLMMDDAGH